MGCTTGEKPGYNICNLNILEMTFNILMINKVVIESACLIASFNQEGWLRGRAKK